MKTLFFMSLLFCLVNFNKVKSQSVCLSDSTIQGRWTQKRIQIQYVVDSHLVHEEENTSKKGQDYIFDGSTVRVEYAGNKSVQGTYRIFDEDNRKKIVIQLPGTTTTYNLIALTSTSMVWQQDLDNTNYKEGSIDKSAERAIYTQEFTKL